MFVPDFYTTKTPPTTIRVREGTELYIGHLPLPPWACRGAACTLIDAMKAPTRSGIAALLICLMLCPFPAVRAFASAYNGHPKLVVIVVIDQFRGDYLERYRDQFGEGGFRLFLDRGADFTDCNYVYANTRTAPGHATLFTGAYSDGHGIFANEWWDPRTHRVVTSVFDDSTKTLGGHGGAAGSSPHNLLASTLGDELKLATQGKSRVYGISLKDRAAVLPAGWAGDGAYWIDHNSGAWITSTYYRNQLPEWVTNFNRSGRVQRFSHLERPHFSGSQQRVSGEVLGG